MFKKAEEMRQVAERVNYKKSSIAIFKDQIMDRIKYTAEQEGKFKVEIYWPFDDTQGETYQIDKELREAGYIVGFIPSYNPPATHIVISWSGHEG